MHYIDTDSIVRGDIYMVDFGSQNGSVQGGLRPALIIQNNVGNKYSPTVLVAPMTSRIGKASMPTHVFVRSGAGGIKFNSLILTEQIHTVNKTQIINRIGSLPTYILENVNKAIRTSLAV